MPKIKSALPASSAILDIALYGSNPRLTIAGNSVTVRPDDIAAAFNGLVPGLRADYRRPVDVPRKLGAVVVDARDSTVFVRLSPSPLSEYPWAWHSYDPSGAIRDGGMHGTDAAVEQVLRALGPEAVRFEGVDL
ncbi:hypothetical protein ACFWGP_05595 [Agromyces sp. NPDC127015]|uniref:hypothetical protein n=1 Tax=Agromyces sp. NPDC127015 TaxID=3347108 RepID=UPI00364D71BE